MCRAYIKWSVFTCVTMNKYRTSMRLYNKNIELYATNIYSNFTLCTLLRVFLNFDDNTQLILKRKKYFNTKIKRES